MSSLLMMMSGLLSCRLMIIISSKDSLTSITERQELQSSYCRCLFSRHLLLKQVCQEENIRSHLVIHRRSLGSHRRPKEVSQDNLKTITSSECLTDSAVLSSKKQSMTREWQWYYNLYDDSSGFECRQTRQRMWHHWSIVHHASHFLSLLDVYLHSFLRTKGMYILFKEKRIRNSVKQGTLSITKSMMFQNKNRKLVFLLLYIIHEVDFNRKW